MNDERLKVPRVLTYDSLDLRITGIRCISR